MSYSYKFEGWLGYDVSAAQGEMVWAEFEPKEWEETDVDIKITHCGICGSDLHNLRSGWVCITISGLCYCPTLLQI
jgi:alcohol dehydrogenase (NADP+)